MKMSRSVVLSFLKWALLPICLFLASLTCGYAEIEIPVYTYLGGNFLKSWLVSDPIPVFPGKIDADDDEAQIKVFDQGPPDTEDLNASLHTGKLTVNQSQYEWNRVDSPSDIIDLTRTFGQKDCVYVYALARIEAPESTKVLVGVGSDDGIRIWLNGRLVHDNWIARRAMADQDVVSLSLSRGMNLLLLKVQNMSFGWGFSLRPLTEAAVNERFVEAAEKGDIDLINLFVKNNIGVNAENGIGLTPLHAARIGGRKQAVDLLLQDGADPAIPMPSNERIAGSVIARRVETDGPGAALLVSQNGRIQATNGFGMANAEKGIPIIPETTFRIGSLTKQFTAAAILKLVESGKMSLNDPLSRYFPDFPRGNEVTIHHLLTHTSGIHSYTDVPGSLEMAAKPVGQDELIRKIKALGYDFDPGTAWHYSNSGYFLLGRIIELVSGESYGYFLKTHIFQPLGMENTGIYAKNVIFAHEAIGYSYDWNEFSLAFDMDMSWPGGSGNLYSTVQDLCKWNEAVFGGTVLSQRMREAAFAPVELKSGRPADAGGSAYGYGWAILELRGLNVIAHTGGVPGFNAFLMRIPDEKLTVVVLSNCQPGVHGVLAVDAGMHVAQIYLWKKMQNQPCYETRSIDPVVLKDYVGRYDDGVHSIRTVLKVGNRLFTWLAGQGIVPLFPGGRDEFFLKDVEETISFVRDGNGAVTTAIDRHAGGIVVAPRLAEKECVNVDPAIYDSYAGKYDAKPNDSFVMTREGNKLYARYNNGLAFQIYPRSETEFFILDVNAEITFAKDGAGRVTGMVVHDHGTDRTFVMVK